jgi:hypothetical protein
MARGCLLGVKRRPDGPKMRLPLCPRKQTSMGRHGALLKNEQDVHLFERLAFLSRREA